MSNLFERGVFTKAFIDNEHLLALANSNALSKLRTDAISACTEQQKPIGCLNELLPREKVMTDGINPREFVIVSGRQIGPLAPGLYFNVVVDEPTFKPNEKTEAYPLIYKYFSNKNVFICHLFPAHARMDAIYWNEEKKRLEPVSSIFLEGKDAALLMRAVFTIFNRQYEYMWVDITDPDKLKEVANARDTTVQELLNTQIKGRNFIIVAHENNVNSIEFVRYEKNNFVRVDPDLA